MVVAPEGGAGSTRVWGWRGWLFAPRSSTPAVELERWLLDAEPPASVLKEVEGLTPTLVLWRDSNPTLQLVHAPQQVWLVTCSLTLVLLVLLLARLPFARAESGTPLWVWLLLSVLLVGLMLGAFFFYMAFEAYHTALRRQKGLIVDEFSSLFPVRGGANKFPVAPILFIAFCALIDFMILMHDPKPAIIGVAVTLVGIPVRWALAYRAKSVASR